MAENSNVPADRAASRFRPIHKALLFGLGVVIATISGVVIVIIIAVGMRDSGGIRAEREAITEKLEAEGYPITEDAWIAKYPPVPDDENAAPIYVRAYAALNALPPEKESLVPYVGKGDPAVPGETYPEEAMVAIRDYLETNQRALELVAEASVLSRARFDGYDDPLADPSPEEMVRALAKLVTLHIEAAATQGDLPAVQSGLRVLHGCARALQERTDWIAGWTSLRLRTTYYQSIEYALNHTTPSEDVLADWEATRWTLSAGDVYGDAIANGARYNTFPDGLYIALLGRSIPLLMHLPDAVKEKQAERVFENFWLSDLRFRQSVLGLLDQPVYEAKPVFNRLQAEFESSFPEHVFLFRDKIALLWLWEARAYERLHGVALALERVRLRTGSLPETLAGLVPDYIDTIPTDPYNGQAIRYSHNEGGYLLYCVGYNLADDGGVAYRTERRKQMEKGDVVFAVHPNPATLRGQAIGGPALE
ncbi:MAG: hypothetical protein L3K26_20775 [Candidatus Hydrogenedentes bacterium]|nr:hypothetical protein [Candidatus Hydrogenedentota bacterium]